MSERFHVILPAHDKNSVSPLLKHAEEIFSAAQGAAGDCEISILVGRDGSIHMLAGEGWALEPLRMHHGASAAYHVSRTASGVRLEARSADESCLLQTHRSHGGMGVPRSESRLPERRMSRFPPALPPDFPQYVTIQ